MTTPPTTQQPTRTTARRSLAALALVTLLTLGGGNSATQTLCAQPAPPSHHIYLPVSMRGAPLGDPSFNKLDRPRDARFVAGGPAYAIATRGQVAFIGLGAHVVALDMSTAGSPTVLGASQPLPGEVRDILLRGNHAYVAVDQLHALPLAPAGLFTLDIHDPRHLRVLRHDMLPFEDTRKQARLGGSRLARAGERIFLLSRPHPVVNAYPRSQGKDGLSVFDGRRPGEPGFLHAHDTMAWDMAVVGATLFLCDGRLTSLSVDAEDDASPVQHDMACRALAAVDGGARLGVLVEEEPAVRFFEVGPEGGLGEMQTVYLDAAFEPEQGDWEPTRLAPKPGGIWAAGYNKMGDDEVGGGTVIEVDLHGDQALEIANLLRVPAAPLDVTTTRGGLAVVGVADDRDRWGDPLYGPMRDPDWSPRLASRVLRYEPSAQGTMRETGRFEGPGAPWNAHHVDGDWILASGFGPNIHEDTRFTLLSSLAPYPAVRWTGQWPDPESEPPAAGPKGSGGAAVTEHGVYLRTPDGALAYDLDGEPDATPIRLDLHGALAARYNLLFVAGREQLAMYDTAAPLAPRLEKSWPLERADERRILASPDTLWILERRSLRAQLRAIDMRMLDAAELDAPHLLASAWPPGDRLALHVATDGLVIVLGTGSGGGSLVHVVIEPDGTIDVSERGLVRPDFAQLNLLAGALVGDFLWLPQIGGRESQSEMLSVPWRDASASLRSRPMPAAIRSREPFGFADLDFTRFGAATAPDAVAVSGISQGAGWFAIDP